MHHAQIEIGGFVGIRLSENIEEIIPYFSELEEFFDFIFFRHIRQVTILGL
jgi:hypothetical protein